MNIEKFLTASQSELASLTNISRSRWSLYLNQKKAMSEYTIRSAADQLGMKPDELMKAIDLRRANPIDHRRKNGKLISS